MVIRTIDQARELLRGVREAIGMFTQEAADFSGVPRSTLNRTENGPEDVKLSTVLRLLEAYGLELVIRPIERGGKRDG